MLRETADGLLGEDELAVDDDVELTASSGYGSRFGSGTGPDLGRETRGPCVVPASGRAEEDLDGHAWTLAIGRGLAVEVEVPGENPVEPACPVAAHAVADERRATRPVSPDDHGGRLGLVHEMPCEAGERADTSFGTGRARKHEDADVLPVCDLRAVSLLVDLLKHVET